MSQFDDHSKHEPPNGSPLFKWVASILGSLTVLLVFEFYKSNNDALIDLSTGLNDLRNDVTEVKVRLDVLEMRLNRYLPPHERN